MTKPLPPGSTIGIMGGGQLGRMTALAAARLGYRCHIFVPETDSPAAQVSDAVTVAPYSDLAALKKFAAAVDVVTFEFENIPHQSVQVLAQSTVVRPQWQVLQTAQDRIIEKDFINGLAIATTPYARANSAADLQSAVQKIGRPAVLKSTRFGYDGKGQVKIDADTDLGAAWVEMGSDKGIVEAFVDLERELSVIMARDINGTMKCYPAVENRHHNHILDITIAPATIPDTLAVSAGQIARKIAERLDLVGLLAVELFVTTDGDLLVNEIAPRPHNSGHWTIDACVTSQFEQFVRAVAGLSLGSVAHHSDAVMKNLIGSDADDWQELTAELGSCLHLYGKRESRPGRKMGHVTRLYDKGSIAKGAPNITGPDTD